MKLKEYVTELLMAEVIDNTSLRLRNAQLQDEILRLREELGRATSDANNRRSRDDLEAMFAEGVEEIGL